MESIIAVMPHASDVKMVQESLRGEGVDLQVTRSPEEALKLLHTQSSSVLIYDSDSGQPWREAIPRFLKTRPGVRVVLLSSAADRRMWLDLFDFGAFDLVMKPFKPAEFRAVLRSAINPPRFFVQAA